MANAKKRKKKEYEPHHAYWDPSEPWMTNGSVSRYLWATAADEVHRLANTHTMPWPTDEASAGTAVGEAAKTALHSKRTANSKQRVKSLRRLIEILGPQAEWVDSPASQELARQLGPFNDTDWPAIPTAMVGVLETEKSNGKRMAHDLVPRLLTLACRQFQPDTAEHSALVLDVMFEWPSFGLSNAEVWDLRRKQEGHQKENIGYFLLDMPSKVRRAARRIAPDGPAGRGPDIPPPRPPKFPPDPKVVLRVHEMIEWMEDEDNCSEHERAAVIGSTWLWHKLSGGMPENSSLDEKLQRIAEAFLKKNDPRWHDYSPEQRTVLVLAKKQEMSAAHASGLEKLRAEFEDPRENEEVVEDDDES